MPETNEIVRFSRFAEFVQSNLPEGLGADLLTIKKLCSDDPEALDLLDMVTVGKPGGDRKSEEAIKPDNVSLDNEEPEHGNSRQYALRRLRKDRPDLHKQVIGGKKSAQRKGTCYVFTR